MSPATDRLSEDGRLLHTEIVAIESPLPIPAGVAGAGAIELCRRWMIYLGAVDCVVASGNSRDACDMFSRRFIAWVDNRRGNLEPDVVGRAVEISRANGRQPLIFVRGGVLPEAKRLANEYEVALFSYVATDGSLEGANPLGIELRAAGLAGS